MAIQHRRGNFADFDPYKMRPGEWAFPLDRGEGYYCISPGDVRRVATKEEIIEILETSQEAYDGLQQLLTELEDETVATGILADISQLLDDVAINKIHIADNRTDIDTNTQDIVNLDDKVNSHLAENATEGNPHGIDAKANKEQPAWIDATLQNGWTGWIRYRKNEIGQIELIGKITPGTKSTGTTIASIPVGFRPTAQKSITIFTDNGGTISGLVAQSNGSISIYEPASSSPILSTWNINEVYNI